MMNIFDTHAYPYGFPPFGAFHIGWIAIIVVLWILCYKPFLKHKRLYFLMPFIPFTLKAIRLVALLVTGQFNVEELPLHLCNLALFVYVIYGITKWDKLEELMFSTFMPGALFALFSPGWNQLPPQSYYTFESFVSHGILVAYPLYLVASGELTPQPRRLGQSLLFLIVMAIPIHFVNLALGTNYCYIEWPLPGTVLMQVQEIFGADHYRLGLGALVILIWLIWYSGYYAVRALFRKYQSLELFR